MHVRLATADDQPAIETLHDRSIREIAGDHYRDAVIEAWTGSDGEGNGSGGDGAETDDTVDEERPDQDVGEDRREKAQPENGRLFVAAVEPENDDAESSDATVTAGFGDVRFDPPEYLNEPTDSGVRAVYVDPAYAGEGVGSTLLERLEVTARDRGLASLGLHSSVNARPFYERHGYVVVEEITFEFGGKVEAPAIEMRKDL